MKYVFLCFLIAILSSCSFKSLSIDNDIVDYYQIKWIANESLRASNLTFNTTNDQSKAIISNLLNKSKVSIPLKGAALIEGWYELEIVYIDSSRQTFELSGGGSIFDVENNVEYKSNELLLFIYQLLFYEFIKNEIVLE